MEAAQGIPPRPNARKLDLGTVSKIEVSSPGTLLVTAGAPASATISAIQEDLDRIEIKNEGDVLKIEFKGGLILKRNPKDEVRYEVVCSTVQELDLSGGIQAEVAKVEADKAKVKLSHGSRLTLSQVTASSFEVDIQEGSQMTVSGVAERQKVRLQDGSQYQALGLDSRDTDIEVNDGSEASIRVREQLKARAADGSRITYAGDNVRLDVRSDIGSSVRQSSST